MNKIAYKNGQEPAIDDNNLNLMQDNAEINRYTLTLDSSLADNSQLTVPANYRVGSNNLQVYFEGELLEKDVHYTEVGTVNSISNEIQLKDWGQDVDAGYTFTFIIQGVEK